MGETFHAEKARQSIQRLENIIDEEPLNDTGERIAEEIIKDLRDALGE